jgi:hypothetical protein
MVAKRLNVVCSTGIIYYLIFDKAFLKIGGYLDVE